MGKKHSLPTTPAHAVRLRFFEPSRRPTRRVGNWQETPWGDVRVEGRLGQAHADLLDAIFFTSLASVRKEDGRIKLLVDPYRLRKVLSGGGQYSGQRLGRLKADLMAALVEMKTTIHRQDGTIELKETGHIVDGICEAKAVRGNPLGGERALWQVTIGPAWVRLIEADLGLRYDPTPIARLQYGISQAVARLMLSHSPTKMSNGIKVKTLFDQLGLRGQVRWNAKRRLEADADGLRAIGLKLAGGKIKTSHPRNTQDGA